MRCIIDQQVKSDIDLLLNEARPKLISAYRNVDTKLYHKVNEEFIPLANRIFMHLYENSDIAWFAVKSCGSRLCNPVFWKYTDLVQSFCDYVEDAQQMFRRVKFAYDNLPDDLKKLITADNDTAQMLKFSNGSSIRVGTSLRSSTFQYLHISEFGKLCNKYPEKAREVVTGSLNTLSAGQYCFIESTAEGRSGPFFDMCCRSKILQELESKLTLLDFKFFFFPWWRCPEYVLRETVLPIPQETEKYFSDLELMNTAPDTLGSKLLESLVSHLQKCLTLALMKGLMLLGMYYAGVGLMKRNAPLE
jgi:hypothetical protein